jgi:hypothetical protein
MENFFWGGKEENRDIEVENPKQKMASKWRLLGEDGKTGRPDNDL